MQQHICKQFTVASGHCNRYRKYCNIAQHKQIEFFYLSSCIICKYYSRITQRHIYTLPSFIRNTPIYSIRINDSNNTHCNISSIIERTESLFLIVVLFLLKLSDLIVTVMHLPVNHRCTSIFKSFTRLIVIWCNPDTLPVISSKHVK